MFVTATSPSCKPLIIIKKLKESGYRYQIEQELLKRDWEIVRIGYNEEWWDDEHWIVQFKFAPNLFFNLCFIVDPMFEGIRKKGQGIYEIKATSKFPKSWNDDAHTIAAIQMAKGKFDLKLKEFIKSIENYKNEPYTQ